jgi:HlyD family secretion protein
VALTTVSVSADDGTAAGLRTAEATTQSVDQELDAVASIEPVSQASVAFPVAGTVATVDVSVGEEVSTGQVLATLETEELERELRDAEAQLDQAELNLERALNGESVMGGTGAGGEEAGGGMPTSSSSASTTATATEAVWNTADDTVGVVEVAQAAGPSDAEISAAQQAVVSAQQAADAAQGNASAAVANAMSLCATVGTADAAGFPAALAACSDALDAATAAQQAVTSAQEQVDAAAATLDGLLDQRATALAEQGAETPTAEPEAQAPEGGTPEGGDLGDLGGGTGDLGSGGTGDTGVSSAQLIALQQEVDVAVLGVLAAQQGVDQATIMSPVDGTVAAVQLASGDDVDAASSTAHVLVVSDGGFEATFSVSVDDVPDLEVGQAAEVLPDGQTEAIEGEVVAIGVAAEGSSYPVTIGIDGDTSELGNGSVASVSVTTQAAEEVVAVPTSAVSVQGDRSTVQVVDGGDVREVEVETGAVGATWIEVLDGLEAGEEVVLADLDEPLPSGATDVDSSGAGGEIIFGGSGGVPPFVGG